MIHDVQYFVSSLWFDVLCFGGFYFSAVGIITHFVSETPISKQLDYHDQGTTSIMFWISNVCVGAVPLTFKTPVFCFVLSVKLR